MRKAHAIQPAVIAIAVSLMFPVTANAQTQIDGATGDTAAPVQPSSDPAIVVTGTRRTDRTVTTSAVPIDVYTPADVAQQGRTDLNSVLQNIVPSLSFPRLAIADGSTFIRPVNLRGLSPDQTLVLINGKRRHRSALVQLDAGNLSLGSQGVDMAQIPAIAIDRVEVLRDGAAAQYGSDAIAGVINFGLKHTQGFTGYARYGQYYQGDGEDYQAAGNYGAKIGAVGFVNLSAEYVRTEHTSRGVQRPDALAIQQAFPNLAIPNPAQRAGLPKTEAFRLFLNGGIDVASDQIYFFGNYGHSKQFQGFNYRPPYTVTGPDAAGTGTTVFPRNTVFNPIYLTRLPNGNYDANGAVFNFSSVYPAGFTPELIGRITDISGVVGYKGEADSGFSYDFSASYGQDRIDYQLNQTLNASMGPASPTSFYDGYLEQRETNFNADFSYPVDFGLAKPVTIAFGAEHRREAYTLGLGDAASWQVGPYAVQTVQNADGSTFVVTKPFGANGFAGQGPAVAREASRSSLAAYLDIEADVTRRLTLGAAVRYEHFADFGGTTNVKGTLRYELSPVVAVRGAASTGFRAPTPGQIYTSKVSTLFVPGITSPVESATLPVNDPAAVYFGAVPLKPETSVNLTAGIVLTPGRGVTFTADAYRIKVDGRIGTTRPFNVNAGTAAEIAARRDDLRRLGVPNYATLAEVRYLTNSFDTRTQGIDVVAGWNTQTGAGRFNTTLSYNYNETKVTSFQPNTIDAVRIAELEKSIPRHRVNFSSTWSNGPAVAMIRVNYYGSWTATATNGLAQTYGGKAIFDAELGYDVREGVRLSAGVQNLFDTYPDRDTRGGIYAATGGLLSGQRFPESSPWGYDGGFWYVRVNAKF